MTLTGTDLPSILKFISTAVKILGSVLMMWGLVGIGLSIKDGQGMSMDTNVGKLIGGALIVASAVGFGMIKIG
jgi:hypothetical protein